MMHIYTATKQPATDYLDQCGDVEIRGGWKPEQLIRAHCCGEKRKAKNCVVQCFYDYMGIWCVEGHGCKHPQAIARKRRKEHMNRSLSQQIRRIREKNQTIK